MNQQNEPVYRLTRAQLLDVLDYTAPGLGEHDWHAEIVLDNWLDGRAITPEPSTDVQAAAARLDDLVRLIFDRGYKAGFERWVVRRCEQELSQCYAAARRLLTEETR